MKQARAEKAARKAIEEIHAADSQRSKSFRAGAWRRSLAAQAGLFLLLLILWPIPIINPIKLLVVLFHELSHTLAAYATGGVVFGIAIDPGGAGISLGYGGWLPGIILAGYVGSLLFGAMLYYLCAIWNPREVWLVLTVCAFGTLALRFFNGFTANFITGTLVLLSAGIFLNDRWQKLMLRLLATSSCLYPIIDVIGESVVSDPLGIHFNGQLIGSDVRQFSSLTGMSVEVLTIFWIILAGTAVVWLMMKTAELDARTEVKKSLVTRRPPKGDSGYKVEEGLVHLSTGPYSSEYTVR